MFYCCVFSPPITHQFRWTIKSRDHGPVWKNCWARRMTCCGIGCRTHRPARIDLSARCCAASAMADGRGIRLLVGPDWRIRLLEATFVLATLCVPLLLNIDWQSRCAYWLLWLALVLGQLAFVRLRPAFKWVAIEPGGRARLWDAHGGEHGARLGKGIWLCDSFCVAPFYLDARRFPKGSLFGCQRLVIARSMNNAESYREFRVWARWM